MEHDKIFQLFAIDSSRAAWSRQGGGRATDFQLFAIDSTWDDVLGGVRGLIFQLFAIDSKVMLNAVACALIDLSTLCYRFLEHVVGFNRVYRAFNSLL